MAPCLFWCRYLAGWRGSRVGFVGYWCLFGSRGLAVWAGCSGGFVWCWCLFGSRGLAVWWGCSGGFVRYWRLIGHRDCVEHLLCSFGLMLRVSLLIWVPGTFMSIKSAFLVMLRIPEINHVTMRKVNWQTYGNVQCPFGNNYSAVITVQLLWYVRGGNGKIFLVVHVPVPSHNRSRGG